MYEYTEFISNIFIQFKVKMNLRLICTLSTVRRCNYLRFKFILNVTRGISIDINHFQWIQKKSSKMFKLISKNSVLSIEFNVKCLAFFTFSLGYTFVNAVVIIGINCFCMHLFIFKFTKHFYCIERQLYFIVILLMHEFAL